MKGACAHVDDVIAFLEVELHLHAPPVQAVMHRPADRLRLALFVERKLERPAVGPRDLRERAGVDLGEDDDGGRRG